MSNILQQIAAHKRVEVDALKESQPLDRFVGRITADKVFRFKTALRADKPIKIIAEMKKASPSRGILLADFNPMKLASQYRDGGASALSVLTDAHFFQGAHEYLEIARVTTGLPILCKDFIIDPYQLYYAKYMGADAVLLIVALHTRKSLDAFLKLSRELGLDCLVEVHSEIELDVAIDSGAELIGVNSRNLKTFEVAFDTTMELGAAIPSDRIKVAESGIFTSAHISKLRAAGYSCFLVGEALVRANDPVELLRTLQNV